MLAMNDVNHLSSTICSPTCRGKRVEQTRRTEQRIDSRASYLSQDGNPLGRKFFHQNVDMRIAQESPAYQPLLDVFLRLLRGQSGNFGGSNERNGDLPSATHAQYSTQFRRVKHL